MSILKSDNKGFTLIEVLMVMVIIGVLASIILASLGSSRTKGVDAAIRSSITNARSQGELYASKSNQSYNGVCAAGSAATIPGIAQMKAGAQSSGSATVNCFDSGANVVAGQSNYWVLQAQLQTLFNGNPQYFCVDYLGRASTSTALIVSGTDYKCP